MIALFLALLSEERIALLLTMLNNPSAMSIKDLTHKSTLHQTTIRSHIEALLRANLLTASMAGDTVKYAVNQKAEVKAFLAAAEAITQQ